MRTRFGRRTSVALLLVFVASTACTITIEGDPIQLPPAEREEICVIENSRVRVVFLEALRTSLEAKGFAVRTLPPNAALSDCPLSATYLGKWSWDFVSYMATGDIDVFQEGSRVGRATYRAPRGGWALTFGIYRSTQTKVAAMVEQLFPERL